MLNILRMVYYGQKRILKMFENFNKFLFYVCFVCAIINGCLWLINIIAGNAWSALFNLFFCGIGILGIYGYKNMPKVKK